MPLQSTPHGSGQEKESKAPNEGDLSKLTLYSLLGGLTALIPVPFLDDWTLNAIRRRMAFDLTRTECPRITVEHIRILVDPPSILSSRGCLYSFFFYVAVVPLRFIGFLIARIFRTILFFFAVKAVSDRASEVFHLGYLLNFCVRNGFEACIWEQATLLRLKRSLEKTLSSADKSPIKGIFKSILNLNRGIIYQATDLLTAYARKRRKVKDRSVSSQMTSVLQKEETLLHGVVLKLGDILSGQQHYLGKLEQTFLEIAESQGLKQGSSDGQAFDPGRNSGGGEKGAEV